jgi:hypothetical protein
MLELSSELETLFASTSDGKPINMWKDLASLPPIVPMWIVIMNMACMLLTRSESGTQDYLFFSLGPSSPVLVFISSSRQYQIQMIGRIFFEIPRLCT